MAAAQAEPQGLNAADVPRLRAQYGPNAIPEVRESCLKALVRKLWAPLPWMLEATILLEFFLGHIPQALIIGGLLVFNAVLGLTQEGRAQAAVAALRQRLALTASVRRDGTWLKIAAADLVPDDVVKLPLGSVVPADLRILSGSVLLDQSMLTGESLPVERGLNDTAYSGALVRRGEAVGIVTATGGRTYFGKSASLVQEAHAVTGEQRAVLSVVRDLAVVNGVVVLAMLAYAHGAGMSFGESVPLLLTALLASIPVALPSTFTLAAALSAHRLARTSVLPTRLSAIGEAATMDLLCSDKTGTLTQNVLRIEELVPFQGHDEAELLALAAAASSEGGDPVDHAIMEAARARGIVVLPVTGFRPFDPALKFSEARFADGRIIRKGAIAAIAPGRLLQAEEAARARLAGSGCRVLAVASAGSLAGFIALADPPRPDAAAIIASLRGMGIRVIMVTGDAPETAAVIARAVGIEGEVCDAAKLRNLDDVDGYGVYAGVFPEDKYRLVKLLQRNGRTVGMCGDGANDAPALRQAQMGIAVSTATDVAKAAAGLVLTEPGLAGILDAIHEGRGAFQRIRTYTLSMVTRKIAFVLYLALGLVITGHGALTPMLMVLLLIINDFLTMAITTDHAAPSPLPQRWRVPHIIAEGGAFGLANLAYALVMLVAGTLFWHLPMPQIRTLSFLTLMLGVQATIYVVRERRRMTTSLPSVWLVASSIASIGAALACAGLGILMAPLSLTILLVIAASAVIFALGLDQVKLVLKLS